MSSRSGRSNAASRLPPSGCIDYSANASQDQRSGHCLPNSLPALGKGEPERALDYRKLHWLLLLLCVERWQWGPCTSISIHTVAQAMLF